MEEMMYDQENPGLRIQKLLIGISVWGSDQGHFSQGKWFPLFPYRDLFIIPLNIFDSPDIYRNFQI
jgi:hypothetical protein